MAEASDIIEDSSEDPEERRRRIEAQQNLEAVDLALDAIAGFIEDRLNEDEDDIDEEYLEEENEEISMTGI